MAKILLTGYAGFLGSSVTNELLGRGYDLVGVYHHHALPQQKGLQQIQLDLLDTKEVDRFFAQNRFDGLIHLAWYVGSKCHTANINLQWLSASLYLLYRFYETGGKKFLGGGTVSEYDFSYGYLSENKTPLDNDSLYGQCKAALFKTAAQFCRQNDIDFQWARIFNLYGPHEKMTRLMPAVIGAMLKGEDVKVSDCTKTQDYLHVFDTACGIVDLFESDVRGAVNVCSGTPVKLRHIVEKIGEYMAFGGRILWGALPSNFLDPFVVGNNERLIREVGWKQQISLQEGLKSTIQWWREQNV